MAGSSFGTIFKITTWGESHGKGLGVVVDGCPAGLPLDENDIQKFLNRRKPGQSKFTTPRKEDDTVSRFYPACLRKNNRYADLSCRVQSEPEIQRLQRNCCLLPSRTCGLYFRPEIRFPRLPRWRTFLRT